jgi:Uncharacterized protein conserved in bacteria
MTKENNTGITFSKTDSNVIVENNGERIGVIAAPSAIAITEAQMQLLHSAQSDLHAVIANAQDVNMQDWEVLEYLKFLFFVELGELANEVEFFKYWKINKRNDCENQLKELADCIHVLLGVCDVAGYQKVIKGVSAFPMWEDADYLDMFLLLKRIDLQTFSDVTMAFSLVLGIGLKLGYSISDMIEAYYTKNQENLQRQADGY